jgi:hypothetical protein
MFDNKNIFDGGSQSSRKSSGGSGIPFGKIFWAVVLLIVFAILSGH